MHVYVQTGSTTSMVNVWPVLPILPGMACIVCVQVVMSLSGALECPSPSFPMAPAIARVDISLS